MTSTFPRFSQVVQILFVSKFYGKEINLKALITKTSKSKHDFIRGRAKAKQSAS